jgi:glyoxylase-like metal-dependent hydrolase (beta-lactamase superfamily II)
VLRILRVLAPNPSVYTLEGTNTWIVGEGPAIVIDPGPSDPGHLLDVRGRAGTIGAVLVTHDHPDHADSAERLAREARAPLFALVASENSRAVRDGDVITVDGVHITALHTPGHTPDHLVFHLASERALFTGDMVLGRGTSVIDPPEGDLSAYLKSLSRLQELDVGVIYPGHGPAVFDAAAKLRGYIEHREEREEQVLAALGDGRTTIPEMVEEIYADYPADVRPLAERSVLAHLDKLEAEGRVGKTKGASYEVTGPRVCERCGRSVRGKLKLCSRCSMELLQESPADS